MTKTVMEMAERNNVSAYTVSTISVAEIPPHKYGESREVLTIKMPEKKNTTKDAKGAGGHGIATDHPTTFLETLTHLLRGNIGSGVFAMGDAFKNGGLILAGILTVTIGLVSVHSQHILLKCSKDMKEKLGHEEYPDFAETVELCIENGPPRIRSWSGIVKFLVNLFICVTQIGFCCIYFVFISSSLKQVCDFYNLEMNVHMHMVCILLPILIPSLITNLKYLAPCSGIANGCMAIGIGVVFYYAFQDLPSPSERRYLGEINDLPLFFGTAIFAFEGIALVLPLKNAMKKPDTFGQPCGVLNIGMIFVTVLFTLFGFIGYLKWGEGVAGSLTLNLPPGDILAQVVKLTVSLGMLLTFPLQFFVPIQIMWPFMIKRFGPFNRPNLMEALFRTIMVFITFSIAELVPKLNLFISLIGALCATALALVFPPIIQLISAWGTSEGPGIFLLAKNSLILTVALLGFSTGTYESISALVREFSNTNDL